MLNRYTKNSRKWNWLFWSSRYHGAICWKDSWERRPQATMTHRINGSAGGIWREKRRMPQPGTWIGNTVFLAYDTPKQIFNEILARPTGWKSGLKHQLSAQISLFVYKEKKREANAHQVKKGNTWHYGGKAHIGVNKDRRLSHIAKVTWINDHHVMRASLLLNGSKAIAYCSSGFLEAGKRVDTAVRNKIERKSTKKSIAVLYGSRDWTRVASMLLGK